jgi:hypothetical protein
MNGFSNTTEQLQALWPSYVMVKQWETPKGFNEELAQLGIDVNLKTRVTDEDDPRNVGDKTNHLGHVRHNFLYDHKDHPAIKYFTWMVDCGVREFLSTVYNYNHEGDITVMGECFYQRRSHRENIGINNHTHMKCDFVVMYYPKIHLDDDLDTNPLTSSLHRGAARFYDPANVGKRFWPVNNPFNYYGGWFEVVPKEGTMMIIEGWQPHDSTYFFGDDRLCLPVLCDVITENLHNKRSTNDIIRS